MRELFRGVSSWVRVRARSLDQSLRERRNRRVRCTGTLARGRVKAMVWEAGAGFTSLRWIRVIAR
jgi:hypothetical protein